MLPISKLVLWSTNNQPRTNAIFLETCKQDEVPALTLEKEDTNLPCLKPLYLSLTVRDPTEVIFAETVFNDITYWLRLREAKFFQKYIEEWREVTDIKRKQLAFESIIKEVEEGGRSSFTAAKFLIDEPWKPKTKEARTSKNKTTEEAFSVFNDDLTRLKETGLLQ